MTYLFKFCISACKIKNIRGKGSKNFRVDKRRDKRRVIFTVTDSNSAIPELYNGGGGSGDGCLFVGDPIRPGNIIGDQPAAPLPTISRCITTSLTRCLRLPRSGRVAICVRLKTPSDWEGENNTYHEYKL
ncbi:hypothetical protein BC937DRAFT_87771 [Endogone sp. FLAS-F59071]|nr:hypothetical protein BC937DRAFT_87771 [Endogone sp. FLAS-F59071]|eukprot:RUS19253.1 hypothetical protein BC937DRAFT_87771 [Endogone sp. FLAS-F59071]